MLQPKDTNRISEIKTEFTGQERIAERFLKWLSFFEFKSVYKSLDPLKQKGYRVSELISMLVVVPFAGKTCMYALLASGCRQMSEAKKDSYYRLKKMDAINWEKLLLGFVARFVKLALKKGKPGKADKFLIVDDTLLEKTGTRMEMISRLWDHVSMRYVLGYRMLVLGYFDGKSFLPVNFSLHREKGKKESAPYGLSSREYELQYQRDRDAGSPAAKRVREMDADKITSAIRMIKKACRSLEVHCLLMDSWFTCEKMLECAASAKVKLIGMMKMGNAKYVFNGSEHTAKELLARSKKQSKRCRKLSAVYVEVRASYKGYPVRLFFSRFGNQARWHLILSTDLKADYLKTVQMYQVRWSIEVFFKESKQYLKMGKSQAEDISAQFADMTISLIQYILLTLRKRFGEYETKGEVFRDAEEKLKDMTLDQRLWGLLLEMVKIIVEILGLQLDDIDSFMADLIHKNKVKKLLKLHFLAAA